MIKRDSRKPAAGMLAIAVTISLVGGNLALPVLAQSGSANTAARSTHGKTAAFQLPMNGPLTEANAPQVAPLGAPVPGDGNGMIIEEVRGWNDAPAPSTQASSQISAKTPSTQAATQAATQAPTRAVAAPSKLASTATPTAVPVPSETTKGPAQRFDHNMVPFNMQECPEIDNSQPQDQSRDHTQAGETQVDQAATQQPVATSPVATSTVVTPTLVTPTAVTPTAVEPTAVEPTAAEPKVESAKEAIQDIEAAAESNSSEEASAVIVIDNDADVPQKAEVVWKEIQDEVGKTKIVSGATFPITMMSSLSSKTAKVGQPIEARLNVDITIGGKLIAKKGDLVRGHVSSAEPARRILHAELSAKRWMRANGAVGLQFDEIINHNGEHLPLVAQPAQHARIVKNKAEGRVLGVNHNGEVAAPLSTQLKHQAAHLAIRGAASAGGVFSFGIVPLAYGVVGAMNPSFAFLHPVGTNVPHRRLKGFAMGVVSGLPGGFLIADTIIRGQEAVVKPGDQFEAEFKQEFTGEAATEATLIPGASSKVRGEILTDVKSKKK